MPTNISYINARGEEIVLDDDEHIKGTGEMYGRTGAEFPSLNYKEANYGDGSTDIIAMSLEPRTIVLNFWMDQRTQYYKEKLEEIKHVLLQTGKRQGNWGKLKIRGSDGHFVYLNCAYIGGLDDVVRESWSWVKYELKFRATDPYFYNGFEYSYIIQQDDRMGYLFMDNALIVGSQTEAKEITKENQKGNLWWNIGNGKYYAIIPKDRDHIPSETIDTTFMSKSYVYDTQAEAIAKTGDAKPRQKFDTNNNYIVDSTCDPKSHWWPIIRETTKDFATKAEATAFSGSSTEGAGWIEIVINGVQRFQGRKTETKYYTIDPKETLYMKSASGNNGQDLFIQAEKVYPEIIINGPAENIIISNETTDRIIKLDTSIVLDVNEQIRIITTPLKRKITQHLKGGSVKNLIPWLSADSTLDWWLEHGSNNVSFNNSTTTPESYIKFIYNERWSNVP